MSIYTDINSVEIMGNIIKEPEIRHTASGSIVATITVGTSRSYKKNEEWQKESEFHNIVVWGRQAEVVRDRCEKGTRVLVKGRITTRSWEDKETQKKVYKTEIVATDLYLLRKYKETTNQQVEPTQQPIQTRQEPTYVQGSWDDAFSGTSVHPDDLPF